MTSESTLPRLLAALAERTPGAPALRYRGKSVSFAALDAESRRVAQGLADLGVCAGDRVALWLPNTPAWLACFFACARLGAIALATNTRFRGAEMEDILGRSEAKALVYWPAFRAIDFSTIVQNLHADATRALQAVVAYTEPGDPPPPARIGNARVHDYATLASRPDIETDAATPDAGCLLFTTSGTTKAPKFVLHAQRSIVQHALDVAHSFGYMQLRTVGLGVLPFCGTYGLSTALAPLAAGAPLLVESSFDARRIAELIAREHVTNTNLTGAMISELLAASPARDEAFSSVRFCGCGSGCPEVIAPAAERGLRVAGVYGSSEVQALFSHHDALRAAPSERALGGGWPASPLARVRARDVHSGAVLPHGESGELEICAPSQLVAYFGNAEATRAAMTADGYFRTGDLGHTLADGRFVFHARMGDVLRLSGFLVSPVQIEAVLAEHPSVAACQVVGVHSGDATRPYAFVTTRPGTVFDEAALIAYARGRMARYKVPARVVCVEAFPTVQSANAIKVQKARLREMAQALAGADSSQP
jgi:fatty-acyl-CoA synthase